MKSSRPRSAPCTGSTCWASGGAGGVKVSILEGEAGLTPGSTHETANSAWGLALDNLYYLVDWNDFGIDDHPVSSSVYGSPVDWFAAHGWRVAGAESGEDWEAISRVLLDTVYGENPGRLPAAVWVKTRKGRGCYKFDNASHGVPHPLNSELFWKTKKEFAEKYGVVFHNFGGPAPAEPGALREEFRKNLQVVIEVLHRDRALVDYLAGSTNIAGFASAFGEFKGYGWYERHGSAEGVLLPQEITEFVNAGIMVGLATVNLSTDPGERFEGFWGTTSAYGSCSYLLYGPVRLFSQLAQDCELKLGKVLWVAGHSGPETADDSRTHFGVFAPGVTQLVP